MGMTVHPQAILILFLPHLSTTYLIIMVELAYLGYIAIKSFLSCFHHNIDVTNTHCGISIYHICLI